VSDRSSLTGSVTENWPVANGCRPVRLSTMPVRSPSTEAWPVISYPRPVSIVNWLASVIALPY
jgi:hypothetical protein